MECAIWYYRYHTLSYELCYDEEDAAGRAFHMEEQGTASVAGIQYSDGSYTPRDEWGAYDEYAQKVYDKESKRWAQVMAKPKTKPHQVAPPFEDEHGLTATAIGDVPEWLGAQ